MESRHILQLQAAPGMGVTAQRAVLDFVHSQGLTVQDYLAMSPNDWRRSGLSDQQASALAAQTTISQAGRWAELLARQGIEVEREARSVTIHAIELLGFSGARLALRVSCSKGTYIRTLAADIGAALGCGAHLAALRRTVVGSLELADALTLADLEARDEAGRLACLLPVDHLLASLPAVTLADEAVQRFSHGNPVDLPGGPGGMFRVYPASGLLGIGESGDDGRLWPKRLVQLAG